MSWSWSRKVIPATRTVPASFSSMSIVSPQGCALERGKYFADEKSVHCAARAFDILRQRYYRQLISRDIPCLFRAERRMELSGQKCLLFLLKP